MLKAVEGSIRPVGEKVLVRPLAPEEKTKGGILIPDSYKKAPLVGLVISVGPGRWNANTGTWERGEVFAGDTVAYNRYAGCEIKTDRDQTLLMMHLDDVLAVLVVAKETEHAAESEAGAPTAP